MKKIVFLIVLVAAVLVSCNSTREYNGQQAEAREIISSITDAGGSESNFQTSRDFSDVIGKQWKLIQVKINGESTGFDRSLLSENFREAFTLSFTQEMVSGTGAPNLYSAPYTLGDNQNIKIMMMRSTLMASIFEPRGLSESDFYNYVQSANEWRLIGEKLELHSRLQDNREVLLVFEIK